MENKKISGQRNYPPTAAGIPAWLRATPWVSSVAATLIGALVLVGWTFDLELLKRGLPDSVAMNPVTAVSFICAGTSLALLLWEDHQDFGRFLGRHLAALVFLAGLLELIGVIGGWQSNIDQLLFAAKLDSATDAYPNRMAPNTAWNLILVGIALFTLKGRGSYRTLSQSCTMLAAFGALTTLTGYLYGVREFRGLSFFIPMALPTAVTFLVLTAGLLLASKGALVSVLASHEPQGILVRRLLPLIILVTVVLGWLRLVGERQGLYEAPFGTALFVIILALIFVLLVRWTVDTIIRLERERANATARLQEANRRKDEMIAIVSHDLCSPLTGFRMVIDLLREGEGRAPAELLEMMDKSARRMVSMVRGLLDVSKLSASGEKLERETLLVSDVIRQSMEPLIINAKAKRIEMDLSIPKDEPVVFGDRLRLSQIFNNLLSNAVKFTASEGKVSISVNAAAEGGICVKVADTGLGIPQNDLPHVFEKYYQAGVKATWGEAGTGLGLAIVRELVLLHQGRIDVTSEVNHGTTFSVWLPLQASDAFQPAIVRQESDDSAIAA